MSYAATLRATSRQAGFFYLILLFLGPLNEFYLKSRFIISGDAAATAQHISSDALAYRLWIFSGFASNVIFLIVALLLYHLFRDVDRKQSRLMLALVGLSVALGMVVSVCEAGPLMVLGGAAYLDAFTPPQLDALAMMSIRLGGVATVISMFFWGFWLFPFGTLAIKSGFFPKWLGVLLIVSGLTYSALAFTSLVLPAQAKMVSNFAMPFYAAGEVAMILWLVIKGANVPPSVIGAPQSNG